MSLPSSNLRPARQELVILTLMVLLTGCTGDGPTEQPTSSDSSTPNEVKIDRRMYNSPQWIDLHDPENASAGYTLALYRRRTPMLIDMNGEVVKAWHGVRAVGRARLLPNGHLAVIGESGSLEEFDWQGRQVWSYTLKDPETFLHHDFIQLANGNYLLLAHDPAASADFLLEVDRSGDIQWRWDAADHLAEDFPRSATRNNRTHVNSVHELPANRWYDKGHEEFRPGNILISARNLDTVYLISRPEGEVVWKLADGLDYQHEAIMIPPGTQGAGNILLFNNGYHDLEGYRRSAILEINPIDQTRVWEFRRRGFFSSTGGTQQALANGNLLITSSQGGRVFELARDGRIVWQWSPPFLPMRSSRYPADYSPQLVDLGPTDKELIERRDPQVFIDEDLYSFSLAHEIQRVKASKRSRNVVRKPNRCRVLQIPQGAQMVLGFGAWNQQSDTPFIAADEGAVHFKATMRVVDDDRPEILLDRTLSRSDLAAKEGAREVTLLHKVIPLEHFYSQTVELCLSLTDSAGGSETGKFVWEEPLIRSPVRRAALEGEDTIDAKALEKQEKHLKAIGYLN